MLLRPYTKADLPALYALDQVCFPPGIAYSRKELQFFLHHPRSLAFVAEEAGHVAGFCICEPVRRSGQILGHVITIDVSPEYRRRGMGTTLMSTMEQEMAARGAVAMLLEVAVDNEPAQTFYLRHGFQFARRLRGYYANGTDAFTMTKPLAA
jgi:ribosomal-protein-alanine N-acetyltransferase